MERLHPTPLIDGAAPQLEQMDAIFDGVKRFALLCAAKELGLFDWLAAHQGSTEEAIADNLGIRGLFCRPFLRALVDMGMLHHAADKTFTNTELANRLLTNDAPFSQLPCLDHLAGPHSYWANLTEILSDRGSFFELAHRHRGEKQFVSNRLTQLTRGELPVLRQQITDWERFAKISTMLAAGDGAWAIALELCRAHPGLTATVLVDTSVHQAVLAQLNKHPEAERIHVQTGPVVGEQATPGGPYELLVLTHALYPYRKELEGTLAEIAGLVAENGLLASCHWFCGTECQPPSEQPPTTSDRAAIQVLERAFYSGGHPLCFHAKFPDHLRAAGFHPLPPQTLATPCGAAQLHLATR